MIAAIFRIPSPILAATPTLPATFLVGVQVDEMRFPLDPFEVARRLMNTGAITILTAKIWGSRLRRMSRLHRTRIVRVKQTLLTSRKVHAMLQPADTHSVY